MTHNGLCHGWGRQSLAPHHTGPDLIPTQSAWNLCWTVWQEVRIRQQVRFYSKGNAVLILQVPTVRGSFSSEPTLCCQGHFYIGHRIQLKCISLCAHLSFGNTLLSYRGFLCVYNCFLNNREGFDFFTMCV
jgi:hypothetical protein